MKDTHTCPKCDSSAILCIQGGPMNAAGVVYLNKWGTKQAYLDRYICTSCGFSEQFVKMTEKSRTAMNNTLDKNNSLDHGDGFV